jgi:predicted nuclease with TOPRIM domain
MSRWEDTQVTWCKLDGACDRVYEEIEALQAEMNERFDRLEDRFGRFEGRFAELERKFDILM